MSEVLSIETAGYCYIKGVFRYSAGVAALPGYEIQRCRFQKPIPVKAGFAAIDAHLKNLGRPINAFCACELRSPEPFTMETFDIFNRDYLGILERWGIMHEGNTPIARSNVCPEVHKPGVPSFYAFSYTVPAPNAAKSCVISGGAEAPEDKDNINDYIVRPGDQSPAGMREKARYVLAEMERRMAALDFNWGDLTGTHLYTVYDISSFLKEEIAERGAIPAGLTWHYARPPVDIVDYEMDVRCVWNEHVIA